MAVEHLLKSISEPTRLEIVRFLMLGRKNASQVIKHVRKSQPNTSLALKQLILVGLVMTEKRGREVFYSLTKPEEVRRLLEILEELDRR